VAEGLLCAQGKARDEAMKRTEPFVDEGRRAAAEALGAMRREAERLLRELEHLERGMRPGKATAAEAGAAGPARRRATTPAKAGGSTKRAGTAPRASAAPARAPKAPAAAKAAATKKAAGRATTTKAAGPSGRSRTSLS